MTDRHVYMSLAYTSSLFTYLLLSAYGPDYGPAGKITTFGRFVFQTSAGFSAALIALETYKNTTAPNPMLSSLLFFCFLVVHLLPWYSMRAYIATLITVIVTLLVISS